MAKLEGIRVLVTGGAGFLGSEVVKQLSQHKAQVTVLDNFSSGRIEYVNNLDSVKLVNGDICDEEAVSKLVKNQELVLNMAALPFIPDCYYYPEQFFKVNTMGTVNVMMKTVRSETVERFIHVSSSEVYGTAKYVPMDELHPTLPHSTYGVSKLAGDRAVFALHKEHGFPTTIVRPFNSYGPNVTQPYIIPEIIVQLLGQGDVVQLGNVESSRDFTFVSDTARGIVLASFRREAVGETVNLGSGRGIKIRDLASVISKLMGKQLVIQQDSSRFRPYDVERQVCDSAKAGRILGWASSVSLEEGLRETIDWLMKHPLKFKGPFRGWYSAYYGRKA